jgi:hypothetical protein
LIALNREKFPRQQSTGNALHPFLVNPTVWANASKVLAIGGTALIPYLEMRLWVFVSKAQKEQTGFPVPVPAHSHARGKHQDA